MSGVQSILERRRKTASHLLTPPSPLHVVVPDSDASLDRSVQSARPATIHDKDAFFFLQANGHSQQSLNSSSQNLAGLRSSLLETPFPIQSTFMSSAHQSPSLGALGASPMLSGFAHPSGQHVYSPAATSSTSSLMMDPSAFDPMLSSLTSPISATSSARLSPGGWGIDLLTPSINEQQQSFSVNGQSLNFLGSSVLSDQLPLLSLQHSNINNDPSSQQTSISHVSPIQTHASAFQSPNPSSLRSMSVDYTVLSLYRNASHAASHHVSNSAPLSAHALGSVSPLSAVTIPFGSPTFSGPMTSGTSHVSNKALSSSVKPPNREPRFRRSSAHVGSPEFVTPDARTPAVSSSTISPTFETTPSNSLTYQNLQRGRVCSDSVLTQIKSTMASASPTISPIFPSSSNLSDPTAAVLDAIANSHLASFGSLPPVLEEPSSHYDLESLINSSPEFLTATMDPADSVNPNCFGSADLVNSTSISSNPVSGQPSKKGRDKQLDTPDARRLRAIRKREHEEARGLTCFNCKVTKTPLWRRTEDKQHNLCNACGLYFKQYKKDRPVKYRNHAPRVFAYNTN